MSHLEMKMRKFRVARKPDRTEPLTRLDGLARAHGDAALAQVRVLRFPAAAVSDDHRVARLPARDRGSAERSHARVLNAVAHRAHAPGCRREHAHPAPVGLRVDHADVGALVAVVREEAATVIARAGTRVAIDVVLYDACLADLAVQGKSERWSGLSMGERRQRGENRKQQRLLFPQD